MNARAFYTSARVGFLIAAIAVLSSCGGAAGDAAYQPVASIDELMDAIVIPSSQALFDAVVYDNQVVCPSQGDNADPCIALGGGSIVIQKR